LLERSTTAEIGTALSAFRPTPLQVLTAQAAAEQVGAATPWDKAAVARACVLLPDAVAEPARLLALLPERADALTRGAVLCRAGRHEQALQLLGQGDEPAALLYRALAEHGRGKPEAARAALAQAEQWLKAPDRGDPEQTNAAGLTWQQRVEVDLLCHEAQAALAAKPPAVP
jgi:hypothetical protein